MAKTFKELANETLNFVLNKGSDACHATANFVRNNPDLCKDLTVIAALTGSYAIKNSIRNKRQARIDKKNAHRDWYYDARSRCYYELSRPMSNQEKMILSRKISKGFLAGDVLAGMGLLRF